MEDEVDEYNEYNSDFEDEEEEISEGSDGTEVEEEFKVKHDISFNNAENPLNVLPVDDDIQNNDNGIRGQHDDGDDCGDNDVVDHTDPEILIKKLHRESGMYLEFSALRINKIKCLALCKILYGEHHRKTAEAHLELADVYLKGKLYAKQALKHSNISRDILLFLQNRPDSTSSLEIQYILLNLYLVIGKANLQLLKYKVAENCLLKAKLVSDNTNNLLLEKNLVKRVEILSALGNTSSKLGKIGQGMEYIEEAIENVLKMPSHYKNLMIKLYKQIVELEILNGQHANFRLASESVKKALDISLEVNGNDNRETAEILVMASRLESLKEDTNYDKVEKNVKEALKIYISIEEREKQLSTQKMHCKILLQQEKYEEAESVLTLSLGKCEEIYGDSSAQCAELFELMGNIYFAKGKMSEALSYFNKAEEIYSQKKNCLKKQQKISKVIEMIRKSSKDVTLKSSETKLMERPRFM